MNMLKSRRHKTTPLDTYTICRKSLQDDISLSKHLDTFLEQCHCHLVNFWYRFLGKIGYVW